MSGKKSCVHAKFPFALSIFSLNIVEKYCKMRNFNTSKTIIQKLINEYFIYSIFT